MKYQLITALVIVLGAAAATAQEVSFGTIVEGDTSIINRIDGPSTAIGIGDDSTAIAGTVVANGRFGGDVNLDNTVDGPATAIGIGDGACALSGSIVVGQPC